MLEAILNKIGIYLSIALCQLSTDACAYGATKVEAPDNLNIKLPAGFSISIYANTKPYGQPRMMRFDAQGNLYIALADTSKVLALNDTNQDGQANQTRIIATNLNHPNSLELVDDGMLVSNQDGVVKLTKKNNRWSPPKPFITNLPTGGHTLKTIRQGPDGYLYLNVGSSCNVCVESNPFRATILRYTALGQPAGHLVTVGRHKPTPVWARGLRNSQAFAWHPATKKMFATNEGADNRSETKNGKVNDALPPEHFNIIEPGEHYGWPYCWHNPNKPGTLFQDPNFLGPDHICETAKSPAITFTSHSTPMGIAFLNKSNFPSNYQSDAIVALHGSWNRKDPSGYKLVRVHFENNMPVRVTDFATGWLNNQQAWGRPVDVAVNPVDGAIFVTDDRSGYVYRITYGSSQKAQQ